MVGAELYSINTQELLQKLRSYTHLPLFVFPYHLNEKALRLCAAADARSLGHGGIMAVSKACKLARNTIYAGIRELETEKQAEPDITEPARIRKVGGG